MGKMNFFADLDVLNCLLSMQYDMKAQPAMDLTVDVLELPFWFSLKNGETSRSLTIYTQMELYSKNEEMAVSKASVVLDDASGNAKVTAPQGLGENMAACYRACRNLSLFAKEKDIDRLWGGSDPEQAGILLTTKNGSLNWKLVSGAERPELTVERMLGGTVKMRPYMDDFWDRSETEMMPPEDSRKEKEAEAEQQRLAEEKAEQERRERERKERERKEAEAQQRKERETAEQKAATERMLAEVDNTLEKARKAGADFELDSDEVKKLTENTTVDLYSTSARKDTARIVDAAVRACDKLYSAYQGLIPALDGVCRPLLIKKPDAKAVKAVAGAIAWLNEESEIENNYAITFNGTNLGNAVKAKYNPSSQNYSIQGFWEAEYNKLSGHGEAESFWKDYLADHKRKASQAEREARQKQVDARMEYLQFQRDAREELKNRQTQESRGREDNYKSNWEEIKSKIEYYRPAVNLCSCFSECFAYVDRDRKPAQTEDIYSFDSTADPKDLSKMQDLCQVLVLFDSMIGLKRDGRVVSNKLGKRQLSKDGFGVISGWRNVKKIEATRHTVAGLCYDGTVVSTRFTGEPLKEYYGEGNVYRWKDVVDIVAGNHFLAGLKADGTVYTCGVSSENSNNLDNAKSWKNVVQIFSIYDELVGITRDGTLLQTGKRNLGVLSAAKDIMAICVDSGDFFVLQSNGTVIGSEKSWHGGKESVLLKELENVVGIYNSPNGMVALKEDGSFQEFHTDGYKRDFPKRTYLFRNYNDYQKEENDRIRQREEKEQKRREDAELQNKKKEAESAARIARREKKAGKGKGFLILLLLVAALAGGFYYIQNYIPADKLPPFVAEFVTKISSLTDQISIPKKPAATQTISTTKPEATATPVQQQNNNAVQTEEKIDFSPFINSEKYKFEYYSDDASAVIRGNLSQKERSFHPSYKEGGYYSYTFFDILIPFSDSDPLYIPRLWFFCYPAEFHNFTGVTITVDGIDYEFSDVSLPEYKKQFEKGMQEELLLIFNESNKAFLDAILKIAEEYRGNDYKGLDDFSLNIVLHGDDEVSGKLDSGFLQSFFAMMDVWEILGQGKPLNSPEGSMMRISK